MKIAYFSRGRGRGHAVPDAAIIRAMLAHNSELEIHPISYSTGFRTLRSLQIKAVDMDLPSNNPFLDSIQKFLKYLQDSDFDLVVAHEEFAAIAAGWILGIKTVFISAWMPPLNSVYSEAVQKADHIFLLSDSGIFPVPKRLLGSIEYFPGFGIPQPHTREDRAILRSKLRIPSNAFCVLSVPSAGIPEQYTRFAELLLSAFMDLPMPSKRLIVVEPSAQQMNDETKSHFRDVEFVSFSDQISTYISSADIVITNASRGVTSDCDFCGIPSLSVSFQTNPIDDLLISRNSNNHALHFAAIDAKLLSSTLISVAKRGSSPNPKIQVAFDKLIRRLAQITTSY